MTVENVFNFYSSDSYQQVGNCLYPYHFPVKSAEDFKEMASHDHVCVLYKNSYRGNENFLESNVRQYDVDNHHSENPEEWITDEQLHLAFERVPHIISRSRNYMKQKGKYSPRPRYHVAVIGEKETDSEDTQRIEELEEKYKNLQEKYKQRFLKGEEKEESEESENKEDVEEYEEKEIVDVKEI